MWVSLFIMLHTGAKGLIYAVIFQNYFSKNTDSTHEVVLNSMLVHVNCISFFVVISHIYCGLRVDDTLTQEP